MQSPEATKHLDGTLAGRLNFTRRAPSLVNDHRKPARLASPPGSSERGAFCDDRPNFMSICSGSMEQTNCLPTWRASVPEAKDPLQRAKKLFPDESGTPKAV